MIIGMR